jgi:hypothetical protein
LAEGKDSQTSDLKRSSSMFTSKTKRMQYMVNGKNQPQAHHQVAYDVEAYTIA